MLRALGNGLKSAVGIALVGATGYCAWDAVGDAAVYSTTKRCDRTSTRRVWAPFQ